MGNQQSSALVLVEKAGEGDIEAVQSLLKQALVDVNVCGEDGRTALFMAAMRGHTRIVELLLGYLPETEGQRVEKISKRVDPNRSDNESTSPLHAAAFGGHIDIVRMLLTDDVERPFIFRPNQTNSKGETPLHIACKKGHKNIVELLIKDKRVDVSTKDNEGLDAFAVALKVLEHRQEILDGGKHVHVFQPGEIYSVGDIVTVHSEESLPKKFSLLKVGRKWNSVKQRMENWVPEPSSVFSDIWERCDVEVYSQIHFLFHKYLSQGGEAVESNATDESKEKSILQEETKN